MKPTDALSGEHHHLSHLRTPWAEVAEKDVTRCHQKEN